MVVAHHRNPGSLRLYLPVAITPEVMMWGEHQPVSGNVSAILRYETSIKGCL